MCNSVCSSNRAVSGNNGKDSQTPSRRSFNQECLKVVSCQLFQKFGAIANKMERLQKGIFWRVDLECWGSNQQLSDWRMTTLSPPIREGRCQSLNLENRKFTTRKIKPKQAETGIIVCDQTARNQLKEMGFTSRKAECKQSLAPE